MTDPVATDVKPFVPARDFELSRRFYKALGWTENWSSDMIAEMELGDARIYLQNYHTEETYVAMWRSPPFRKSQYERLRQKEYLQ